MKSRSDTVMALMAQSLRVRGGGRLQRTVMMMIVCV